jgi:hypothetical protein
LRPRFVDLAADAHGLANAGEEFKRDLHTDDFRRLSRSA